MKTVEFLSHLRSIGVELSASDDRLRISAPRGALSKELRDELAQRKDEILAFIRETSLSTSQAPSRIPRTSRDAELPLSMGQQRLWMLDQFNTDEPAYNLPMGYRVRGPLDVNSLERSLREIVSRHESLRTTFEGVDGRPRQVIHADPSLSVVVDDLQELPASERESEAKRRAAEEGRRPFDLSRGPLLRVRLFRLGPQDHVLLLVLHHIVCDVWSLGILTQELTTLYEAISEGKPSPLPPVAIQYADFAHWQRKRIDQGDLEHQLEYWTKQLQGAPASLDLPTDRTRPPVQTFSGAYENVSFSHDLLEGLRRLSRSENATLFVTLLAGFQTLLFRYTGEDDVAVGIAIANRTRPELEALIGFFVNSLALRGDLSGNPTFRELQTRLRQVTLDAYANQDISMEQLMERLDVKRDMSRSPLFQVMLTLQNVSTRPLSLPGLELSPFPVHSGAVKFDLTIYAEESDAGLEIAAEYNTDLFDASTIRRMLGHYERILEGAVADPECRLRDLPLLRDSEPDQLLSGWTGTRTDYPRNATIPELFEEQVRLQPAAVALTFEREELSYDELDSRANRVANYLRDLGVGPDVMVGLCTERSVEMVVGMLGILKAGGAYVPLDPGYPAERLEYMISDTQAPVLLTQSQLADKVPKHQAQVVCLDTDWPAIAEQSSEVPRSGATSTSLAYVIYTSGSTGKPKGTTIPHRAVTRLVKNTNFVELGPEEVFLQFAPISFDASTFELWGSLLNGSKLVVFPPHTPSLEDLGEFIEAQGITTLWLTAALFAQMVDRQLERLRGVRQLLAGGDVLSVPHVKKALSARGDGQKLINGYGPTENTTFTCCHVLDRTSQIGPSVPIGKPISNTTVYLLDEHMKPVPVGVPGELYTGGDGLAREYLNQPELTAEKFVADPFSEEPQARLYRIGDLCRWREDGTIEFIGRRDSQVKIRGFRVELGEIESALNEHGSVSQAAAMIREDDPGERRLVAYVVPLDGERPQAADLREDLQQRLPSYMMPSAFVLLDVLPLNPNGKVDRDALPAPDRDDDRCDYVAPRTSTEKTLAAIFGQVLRLDRVSVDEDFFELGGHSLLATQVVSLIRKKFKIGAELALVFEHPTVNQLAPLLDQQLLKNVGEMSEKEARRFLQSLAESDD